MKAMAVKSYGPIEHLTLIDIAEPAAGKNEVRVRVRGSSVNPADLKVITGKVKVLHGRNFPLVVGYDFAGEVDAIGEGVAEFKMGDRIFGFLPYSGSNRQGAFSEKISVPTASIARMPDSLAFENGGTVATAALTALQGLRSITPGAGKKVLINGASGGVGCYAVQIARLLGASVTATCSAGAMEFVQSLGAERVVDYRQTSLPELKERYEIILDVAAKLPFFKVRHLLEAQGRFISLLPSLSVIGGILLRPFLGQKCSFLVVKSIGRDLAQIARWIEEKKLAVPVDKIYSLKNVADAIRHLEKGGVKGKIGITID
jgi:NADPH:quinone reductase-like Zn-dependent oxidoreductase